MGTLYGNRTTREERCWVLIEPSLDEPCTALCIIDRAPKPRVTGTELKSSNTASFVMSAAVNQRRALSSRSLRAVHDGHERSEFGRMQASRRPNQ